MSESFRSGFKKRLRMEPARGGPVADQPNVTYLSAPKISNSIHIPPITKIMFTIGKSVVTVEARVDAET